MANKSYRYYTTEQACATCDLFKVLPESYANEGAPYFGPSETLKYGLLFLDRDFNLVHVTDKQLTIARNLYGVEPEVMNNTFYKDFKTVLEKSRYDLFVDQVLHYASTYGRDSDSPQLTYIPMQEINVPDVDVSRVKVTVIQLVADVTIAGLIDNALATIQRPSARIIKDMCPLLDFATISVDDIRSFELVLLFLDKYQVVPGNARLWLRLVVYKLTAETMVVNSRRTCVAIQRAYQSSVQKQEFLLTMLEKANKPALAAIFLRYKNIFLAFKKCPGCAPIINRLRRMADTYHAPMSDACLQNYIQLVLAGRLNEAEDIRNKLDNRDLVKLINAITLTVNTQDGDPRIFNIRNGRAFCKENSGRALNRDERGALTLQLIDLHRILRGRLKPTISGRIFYIPQAIHYVVPCSEKQFSNNIPWGTKITMPRDLPVTVGVSWFNDNGAPDGTQTDLDLHAFTPTQHFGWNSQYVDRDRSDATVVYSGDMTDAPLPNGAAEAFWVHKIQYKEPVIFNLSKFMGMPNQEYKVYFATTPNTDNFANAYTQDPNSLVMAPMKFCFDGKYGQTIGFLEDDAFTIYGGSLDSTIVPKANFGKYMEGLSLRYEMALSMQTLLGGAGAKVIRTMEEADALRDQGIAFTDLSPEAITVSTLLDLVDGK